MKKNFLFWGALVIFIPKLFALELTSVSIKNGGVLNLDQVANQFGCHGKNLSPQLAWKNIPPSTKSFALTVYDPDAPTGNGFWHWIVYNINKNTTQITLGASNTSKMPLGSIESPNDAGFKGYIGACPPNGAHHYIFTVYALNIARLPIKPDATEAMTRFTVMQHVIAKASIVTTYAKK